MAERLTLARPYARAAFEVASAEGKLQPWSEALSRAVEATSVAKLRTLLSSPALTPRQKSEALEQALGEAPSPAFSNFIVVLAENKRLLLLPEIRDLYLLIKAQREKTIDVAVTSAFPITDQVQQRLSEALSRNLARQVKLTTAVDKSLLGGALIRAGDTVIDGSVKGRLVKLAEAMNA